MTQRHIHALSHSHTHNGRTSFRQPGLELTWQTCNFYLWEKSCFGTMGIFHSEGASALCPPFCIHNRQSCVAALTRWISSFWLFLSFFQSWSICCLHTHRIYFDVTRNVNAFATRHAFPRSVLLPDVCFAHANKRKPSVCSFLSKRDFMGTIRGWGIFSARLFKYINEYTGISLMWKMYLGF